MTKYSLSRDDDQWTFSESGGAESYYLSGVPVARSAVTYIGMMRERSKLDNLSRLPDDWDGNGSARPERLALVNARLWLDAIFAVSTSTPFFWIPPHISASESGEIVFEWWWKHRKLTIYFGTNNIEYIKVWGPDIDNEMEMGVLSNASEFAGYWNWLFGR